VEAAAAAEREATLLAAVFCMALDDMGKLLAAKGARGGLPGRTEMGAEGIEPSMTPGLRPEGKEEGGGRVSFHSGNGVWTKAHSQSTPSAFR
jgi:hypothetical protein